MDNDRTVIRWYCPECHRTDPRHPVTKAEELPEYHNRPERMGFESWDRSRDCHGQRIPQRFDKEKNEWINETSS